MQKNLKLVFWAISAFLFACQNSFCASYPQEVEPYFEGNSISVTVLNPPPAVHSAQKQKEISEIIELQKHVNEKQIASARYKFGIASEKFVTAVNPHLTRDKYPALYHLLMRSRVTAQEVKDRIKDHFSSPHPYQVSKEIKALLETDRFYSYPSGHATKCYVLAYVMADLLPQEGEKFINEARDISHLRIIVGEHFPSDVDAGRKLADIIYDKMKNNYKFQADFRKAKKELKNYKTQNSAMIFELQKIKTSRS